jgi:hypothetical protein
MKLLLSLLLPVILLIVSNNINAQKQMNNIIQNGESIYMFGKVSKITESNNEYIITLKFDKNATNVSTSNGAEHDVVSTKNKLPDPNINFVLSVNNKNSNGELKIFILKDLKIKEIKNDVITVIAQKLPFNPKDFETDFKFTFEQSKVKNITLFGIVDEINDLKIKNQLTILVDRNKTLSGNGISVEITNDTSANPDLNTYCLIMLSVKPSDKNTLMKTKSLGNGKIIEIVENRIKILFEDEISFPIEEIKKGMEISISSL